jgi:drug/metabolite transporter (DMT)-like permease
MPENQNSVSPSMKGTAGSSSGAVRSVFAGVLMMAVAMSLIGIIDAIAKVSALRLHGLQVTWIYFAAMWLSLLLVLAVAGKRLAFTLKTTQLRLQCLRGICILGSLSLLFTGLTWLPLAEATMISFTAPLFIVALAGPVLKEVVSRRSWVIVSVGLIGALLVIRPGSALFQWASFLPLIGAVFFALFNIVTRLIGRADSAATTLFYTFGIGTLALLPVQPLVWQTPPIASVAQIGAAGSMGVLAHLLIALSLQRAPTASVAPLNYLRLIWALALGYWWFGDMPDSLSIVGAGLIVGSGVATIYLSAADNG